MTSTSPDYGVKPSGYRLPETTHIGGVVLQIADLERSLAFYQQVLGLKLISRTDASATLGDEHSLRTLLVLVEKKGVNAVPRRGLLGLYHFAILLPDRAALGRFVRHLGDISMYFGSSDHLVSEALYLTDPDGLGIEVYADRPRDTWRVTEAQLTMASNPLDLDDLVRAAGEVAWSGMPADTTIGHVHLYVGDLEQASRFYHEGLGLDKIVWSYPGALFLSAGGYHHHLGTNTWAAGAPVATDDDARMLEWRLHVSDAVSAEQAARNIEALGYTVTSSDDTWIATDPWGVNIRIAA